MAALTDYNSRGLKIVTPEPLSGTGGQALNDNFKAIAGKLNFTPSSLTALVALDMGTNNITNVGTVDGVDISAISLSSMPTAAAGAIACNGQNITSVGTVDGKDVSTLIDGAGAILAVEAEATLEFDAATVISTAAGNLGLTTTGTNIVDINGAGGVTIDSATTSNFTLTANTAAERVLTIKADNDNNSASGDSKVLVTATKTHASAMATVNVAGDVVDIDGNIRFPYRAHGTGTTGTILATDHIITADSSGAAIVLTLPVVDTGHTNNPAKVDAGTVFIIKDIGGAANTYNITVQHGSSEGVDGGTNTIINAAYGSVKLFCNGIKWYTI